MPIQDLAAEPAHRSSIRLRPPIADLTKSLGLLGELPGTWSGTGFNLIWRPNFAPIDGVDSDHFLELNLTKEHTKFDFIGAPIPNRGLAQADITLFGVHYLQQISDIVTLGALHIEPGIWVNIPASTQPDAPLLNQVARLSTIPHGNALVAQGQAFKVEGGPVFAPANVSPFPIVGGPPIAPLVAELTLTNPTNFRTLPPPPTVISPAAFQKIVLDPNSLLADAIVGQNIVETTVIQVATSANILVTNSAPQVTTNGEGGVENIAFLDSLAGTPPPLVFPHTLPNAVAADVFATFWIEKVEHKHGAGHFLQLQYTQTVYLNFATLTWPHVSVATLVRSSVV